MLRFKIYRLKRIVLCCLSVSLLNVQTASRSSLHSTVHGRLVSAHIVNYCIVKETLTRNDLDRDFFRPTPLTKEAIKHHKNTSLHIKLVYLAICS